MNISTTLNTSKIIVSILTLTIAMSSFAQDLKNPGYVAKSRTYEFKKDKEKMPMKGIIF